MSVGFRAVQWNRAKLVYDGILVAAVVVFIGHFRGRSTVRCIRRRICRRDRSVDPRLRHLRLPDADRRSCASARWRGSSPRFLPLLYNRRHFGVLTFVVAAIHAWLMIEWYLVQDDLPSLADELTTWADYGKFIGFPFKVLGIAALLILFLMAATSHDFWLHFPDAAGLEGPAHGGLSSPMAWSSCMSRSASCRANTTR